MIKSIIFDFYGTLVDIHTNEEKEEVWKKFALYFSYYVGSVEPISLRKTYDSLVSNFLENYTNTDYPEINLVHVYKKLFHIYGYQASEENILDLAKVFRMLSTEYIRLYPHTLALLKWLKNENIDLYILSNAQKCFLIPEINKLGISSYFKEIFISSDHEISKPDINFISKLIDQENIDVESCLFIGNDPSTDIELANKINMTSLYVHSNCSPPLQNSIKADYLINPISMSSIKKIIKKLSAF